MIKCDSNSFFSFYNKGCEAFIEMKNFDCKNQFFTNYNYFFSYGITIYSYYSTYCYPCRSNCYLTFGNWFFYMNPDNLTTPNCRIYIYPELDNNEYNEFLCGLCDDNYNLYNFICYRNTNNTPNCRTYINFQYGYFNIKISVIKCLQQ